MNHEELLDAAKKAADKLFADTSAALIVTLASLHELREHVNRLIETLEDYNDAS